MHVQLEDNNNNTLDAVERKFTKKHPATRPHH